MRPFVMPSPISPKTDRTEREKLNAEIGPTFWLFIPELHYANPPCGAKTLTTARGGESSNRILLGRRSLRGSSGSALTAKRHRRPTFLVAGNFLGNRWLLSR